MRTLQPNTVKPADPNSVETYLGRIRQRVNPTESVLQELKEVKQVQLETKQNDLQEKVLDLKNTLVEQQLNSLKPQTANAPRQDNNIAAMLFKDKSPEQIDEILTKLTPEMLQKLKMIAEATDTSPVTTMMRQQTQPPPQTGNDMLLQYLLKKADEKPQPQQGITMSDVVAIVRLVNEGKTPAVQAQPQGGTNQIIETVKAVAAINELSSRPQKELLDLKLKQIEERQPPDPIEQIKYVKEVASTLGLSGGQKTEVDLKLEEMRQNQNVDMKRLDWEQRKYEMEMEADSQKWEQITKIMEGPIGKAISNMGSAGADRVRGRPAVASGKTPKAVQTQCPNCLKAIWVDAEAETAVCGQCGAFLQKQAQAEPQPPAPAPAPQKPAPVNPNQVQESEPTEEDVEEGEEEEVEADESEGEGEPEQ